MAKKWLTTAEAAEFLGVTVSALGRWRTELRGPKCYRNEGFYRYAQEDLEAYLASVCIDPNDTDPQAEVS